MYDLLFTGARVVDGTGNPWFWADVAVQGDKVVAIGKVEGRARREVRAAGRLLTPGFIDAHSHSDASLLVDPAAESKVRQGVTTEVIGNCGFSLAPLTGAARHLVAQEVQELELELAWSSLGAYLAALRRKGTAVNVVPLVGQGTVRRCVLGEEDRKPTPEELVEMSRLVEQALAEGAHGLSTGLVYPPGCFSATEELIALCRPVRQAGGIYASHVRDEGDELVEAVGEAIEIGVKAGLPVHLSHHKAAGPTNWGQVGVTLRMLEEARSKGQEVTCDVYPYTAS
ncbi:MAG: amidohydrolase family protein, partial [Bacillota bacterium]|nr:amidohydrolase family protein [Bacillota bacterium]